MAIIIHVSKRIYNLMGGKHSRSGSFQNLLDYGIRLPLFNAIKLDSLLERQKTHDREDRLSLVVLPDPHVRLQQHCDPSASGQNNVSATPPTPKVPVSNTLFQLKVSSVYARRSCRSMFLGETEELEGLSTSGGRTVPPKSPTKAHFRTKAPDNSMVRRLVSVAEKFPDGFDQKKKKLTKGVLWRPLIRKTWR